MKPRMGPLNRRTFLEAAGLATFSLTGRLEAAEWTDLEKANVKVVNDFLHARWNIEQIDFNRMGSFLADDCVRGGRSTNFIRGREAIIEDLKRTYGQVLKRSLKVIQTLAIGPIVINERIESQTLPGREGGPARDVGGHVVGMFEVRDGRIKEWRAFGFE